MTFVSNEIRLSTYALYNIASGFCSGLFGILGLRDTLICIVLSLSEQGVLHLLCQESCVHRGIRAYGTVTGYGNTEPTALQPPRRQNVCCGKTAIFRHAVQPHVLINVRECDVSFFLWASLLLPTPIGLLWLVAAGHSSFVIVVKT